jgi:hypothetical protein
VQGTHGEVAQRPRQSVVGEHLVGAQALRAPRAFAAKGLAHAYAGLATDEGEFSEIVSSGEMLKLAHQRCDHQAAAVERLAGARGREKHFVLTTPAAQRLERMPP